RDSAVAGRIEVDVVDPRAEVRNQLQLRPCLRQHGAINPVRHRGHQHVSNLYGLDELALAHGLVVYVEPRVEQLTHTGFDDIGELACDNDERFLARGWHG